jgi:hypothetical protein
VIAIENITFDDIIHTIVVNDYLVFFGYIISFLGFILTIYVMIKTKNIDKRLADYKLVEQFNIEREMYIKTFRAFKTSLTDDNADIYKIKYDIYEETEKFKSHYHSIIGKLDKINIFYLCRTLKKEKNIKTNDVCNYLTKLLALLSNKKENYYGK